MGRIAPRGSGPPNEHPGESNEMTPTTIMAALGKTYEQIYRLPRVGDPLVRAINRGVAWINFNSHIVRRKRYHTLASFKKEFLRLVEIMQFPIEVVPGSETPDRFEIYVHGCPFGYRRPDQQGVCDATMEMDRGMFGRMGADLEILETVIEGAASCRIAVTMKDGAG